MFCPSLQMMGKNIETLFNTVLKLSQGVLESNKKFDRMELLVIIIIGFSVLFLLQKKINVEMSVTNQD